MDQDEKIVQEEELAASGGQDDRSAYVAYKGKVYDVSKSRLWRGGVHVRRQHAGQDLTADLAAAPCRGGRAARGKVDSAAGLVL